LLHQNIYLHIRVVSSNMAGCKLLLSLSDDSIDNFSLHFCLLLHNIKINCRNYAMIYSHICKLPIAILTFYSNFVDIWWFTQSNWWRWNVPLYISHLSILSLVFWLNQSFENIYHINFIFSFISGYIKHVTRMKHFF
jgi:hypothetical protein